MKKFIAIQCRIITSLLLFVLMSSTLFGQSDVTIGPYYRLNLQRQNDNADAFILHNAKADVSSAQITRWETSHPSFGSRGIQFSYLSGIHFFADAVPTAAGNIFNPTTRMFIGNNGNIGVGTTSPGVKLTVQGAGGGNVDFAVNGRITTGDASNAGGIWVAGPLNMFMGQVNTTSLGWYNNGSWRMIADNAGNIGIGTTTPGSKLDILHNLGTDGLRLLDGSGFARFAIGQEPSYTGNYLDSKNIDLKFKSYSAGGTGGNLIFYTGVSGASERMRIDVNGNLGLGTTTPDAKLAVKGQIHAQEVKVDLNGAVAPDYVFANNYKLPTLDYIKTYIDQNKHLPEVPSAKEMETNGVNLGEMNMLLLKKIEELTLYVIELKKRDEAQQVEIEQLKTKK